MQILKSAQAFQFRGKPLSCTEFGSGHINSTYKIDTDSGYSYVLQKINKYAFKEPDKVMANASAVTNYLNSRGSGTMRTLTYVPTINGTYCHQDAQGEYWRMYEFIPGFCLDAPENDRDFYHSALAFGQFQSLLVDYPAHTLYETIPNFHNTPDRFRQLWKSVSADAAGRAASVSQEIEYLREREQLAGTLQRMLDAGKLPLRVTHNDTKLNNVLLDPITRKGICVLDLDTVMPGLSAMDFGDAIRFGAATANEDEQDAGKNSLDLHLFEVYTRGYLEAAYNLTNAEIEMLPMGALVVTLELATRFLKDYLDGDLYFKIAYPEHNLVRARSQIALAADMQKKLPEMERIVKEVRSSLCVSI